MKQILSIADFAIMLQLVQKEINSMEQPIHLYTDCMSKKDWEKRKKEHFEKIRESVYYKSLMHIMESLESLNIEVEVPDVDVKK